MMGIILHPIRTLVLVGLAFGAGMIYEKYQQNDRCLDAGGRMEARLCHGN